jgi:hypothetical protein
METIKMKKIALVFAFAVLSMSAAPASAFIHFTQNEFMTAESLDPGMTQTGIHFTLGENYKSYYPQIRYGLGAFAEVGVKFGVTSADFQPFEDELGPGNKVGALVGVDLKYQLVKETEGIPLDMAVDIGFDNTLINTQNISEVTFSTIFSKSFPLTERGYKIIPYGGLEMSNVYGSGIPKNDTSVYLFTGMEWKLSQKFMVLFEYKGGDYHVGGIGIRFEY